MLTCIVLDELEEPKKYFDKAKEYYKNKGRVEYLAFVYMEYAKFLEKNIVLKENKKFKDYNKEAKRLFRDLGYESYLNLME